LFASTTERRRQSILDSSLCAAVWRCFRSPQYWGRGPLMSAMTMMNCASETSAYCVCLHIPSDAM
jgi:hypothetical protein